MLEQLNAYTGALLLFCGALLILGCALLCMLLVRQRRQQERMRDPRPSATWIALPTA